MRKLENLLDEYGESHQDETNKLVHWICVPVIFWSITALSWSLPIPIIEKTIVNNWCTLALIPVTIYYLVLSWQLALGMLVFSIGCLLLNAIIEASFPGSLWKIALSLFVIAWIAQFWGHKIEGKKPSFLKDIQFLLIGPAWLLHFIYKRANIAY
ncbi:DUF962 domain-containing protein [Polycladidibacter stylochi]|uniref:Mpo1 family 2-hydroxy fatty acid dioxygenase n=1 Tax=Polycladidibacter stylochi TaxID=1807766 RepID=UPI00082A75A4|nr:Mpo1-like protein [Pseudovibrio stylochi]